MFFLPLQKAICVSLDSTSSSSSSWGPSSALSNKRRTRMLNKGVQAGELSASKLVFHVLLLPFISLIVYPIFQCLLYLSGYRYVYAAFSKFTSSAFRERCSGLIKMTHFITFLGLLSSSQISHLLVSLINLNF